MLTQGPHSTNSARPTVYLTVSQSAPAPDFGAANRTTSPRPAEATHSAFLSAMSLLYSDWADPVHTTKRRSPPGGYTKVPFTVPKSASCSLRGCDASTLSLACRLESTKLLTCTAVSEGEQLGIRPRMTTCRVRHSADRGRMAGAHLIGSHMNGGMPCLQAAVTRYRT